MTSLLHLFCHIDDFYQEFLPQIQARQIQQAGSRTRMEITEALFLADLSFQRRELAQRQLNAILTSSV
jgi:hypothetical protein